MSTLLNSSISSKSLIVVLILVISSLGVGLIVGERYAVMKSQIEVSEQIFLLQQKIDLLTKDNTDLLNNLTDLRIQFIELQGADNSSPDSNVVRLGYISSTTASLATAVPHLIDIIEPDINEYAESVGSNLRFEFIIEDAMGQAVVHLDKVQELQARGITLIIGGGRSGQAQGSLSYVNENDMLVISPSATSTSLSIPDDNLFRTCADGAVQAVAIVEMMESYGIEAVIVMQRGDTWADELYNSFQPVWTANNGIILEHIRYDAEETDFSSHLQSTEDVVKDAVLEYGKKHVGVLMISFSELVTIITQAEDFSTIYDITWFGSEETALTSQALDDAPEQAAHLKIYSVVGSPPDSTLYNSLYNRFYDLTSQPYDYYSACAYDAAFVIAKAVIESSSKDADDVIELLPSICASHYGASGLCALNSAGDRATSDYQILGYGNMYSTPNIYVCGFYDATSKTVVWDPDVLGLTPVGR